MERVIFSSPLYAVHMLSKWLRDGLKTAGVSQAQNRLYAGEQIWNRQRFIKDPSTGKRVSRPNPETEWVRKSVPTLRIVDEALFAEAAAIKARKGGARPFEARRPPILAGKLVGRNVVFPDSGDCLAQHTPDVILTDAQAHGDQVSR